jgi:hypothetical protein
MWTTCPVVLDEPVTIVGLELEDLGLTALTLLLASLALTAILSLACAVAVGLFLSRMKRGKAPGALLHTLHQLELMRLPGVLSPRPQRYGPW